MQYVPIAEARIIGLVLWLALLLFLLGGAMGAFLEHQRAPAPLRQSTSSVRLAAR